VAATGAVASGECGSGALGGVSGEIAASLQQKRIQDRLRRELADGAITEDQAQALAEDMRAEGVDIARLAAALSAALAGGDADTGADAGANAAENNVFWIPVIAVVAALWTAYDIAETYREEGGEAALKQLALDGAIAVATGGAGKIVYKVGGRLFKSAPKAYQAVKKLDTRKNLRCAWCTRKWNFKILIQINILIDFLSSPLT